MESPDKLIDKAHKFLKQQRDMYGDFSIPSFIAENSTKEDLAQKTDVETTNDTASIESQPQVQETTQTQSQEAPEEVTNEPEPELTLQERLSACNTLEDLRKLCEQAEELKTDLEGTNLVFGVGDPHADLMIVGEAPGQNEDEQGEPFVGQAGQLLDKIMDAVNFKREDIYIANILKHRPPQNRDPKPEERERSLPFLIRQIEIIDPKIILCVGRVSATTLLQEDATLKSMRNQFHSFHGRELMVTYHPAALLRNQQWKRPTWEDVKLLRKRYDELT